MLSGLLAVDLGLGASMRFLRLLALVVIMGVGALSGLAAPPIWGGQEDMTLSQADRDLLLKLARSSIKAHFQGEGQPALQDLRPSLREPRGAFVTLHRQGRLRGCIGYIEAVKPLDQTVLEMATAAAFHDPRFSPLREEELADLEIEISVLSPLSLIKNIEEIEVGRHGLLIARDLQRGLLLPQVATERRWSRRTFLEQTCLKAGLPPDAWKEAFTRIYVFTAEIFADHPSKAGGVK